MVQATQNQRGFTYKLTNIGKAFLSHASSASRPVLDIGAAYGVATLPALQQGASVVAVDISQDHLEALEHDTPTSLRDKLATKQGRFPEINFPASSFSGVYISQVFPFLSGQEIQQGVQKIYEWLEKDGKVFVVSFTPYLAHVASFIPVYEARKASGKRWAGYIDNLPLYCSDQRIGSQLPEQINHVDSDDLRAAFSEAGFVIEHLHVFGDENLDLPEGIKYDGRERIGLIARKPS